MFAPATICKSTGSASLISLPSHIMPARLCHRLERKPNTSTRRGDVLYPLGREFAIGEVDVVPELGAFKIGG